MGILIPCFLTQAEKDFFDVLEGIIRNKYYIFPQINISKLFLIEKGNNYYKHYNRINRKSVDFVLVDKNSLTPLLAIELDDSSHNRQDRMDRDNFVDDIFKNAEIPLLRIKCSREYNIQDISNLIYGNIQTKNS